MANIPENRQLGLMVGIATRGIRDEKYLRPYKVAYEWAWTFLQQNYPMNCNRSLTTVVGLPIAEARTQMAEAALAQGAKYLWFLDDDVAPPAHAARKLMYDLEMADDDVMIAGGIYTDKAYPVSPMVFNGNGAGAFWKWKINDVFPCTGIGTGCMMIKTELFTKLPKPWFQTVDNPPDGIVVMERITDDLFFCNKVIENGYKIIADGSVICVHWNYDTDPPVPFQLPADSYPFKEDKNGYRGEPTSVSPVQGSTSAP